MTAAGTRRPRRLTVLLLLTPLVVIGGCSVIVVGSLVNGRGNQGEPAPASYSFDYRCELFDGLLVASGTMTNNMPEERRLEVVLTALSGDPDDDSISVSQYFTLAPRQTQTFERAVADARSVRDRVAVDDGYRCVASVLEG